jgi:ubiquitin C-terminal hydrolase
MTQYIEYDQALVPPPFGLNNTGAICWGNSLIQFMLGIPSLSKVLLENEKNLSDNPFAMQYINLIKRSLALQSEEAKAQLATAGFSIIKAMLMRAHSKNLRPKMGTGQECADEAFTLFIEMLECPRVEKLFNSVSELSVKCKGCNETASSVRDKSLRITIGTDVVLNTHNEFNAHIRVRTSEVDFHKCPKCEHRMASTPSSKIYRVEKLRMISEVIVIMFDKYHRKDRKWFPEELTFNGKKDEIMRYKLVSKIEHSGTMNGGHYWCDSLRENRWVNLNDRHVSPGNATPSEGTFMIAYNLVSS